MKDAKYIFSGDTFKRNVDSLRDKFEQFGLEVVLGYSVKTNNSMVVLNAAKENGLKAEVVSTDEAMLAAMAGFQPGDIIFNGVVPDPESKFAIAANGGIVNVDNYVELVEIGRIAKAKKTHVTLNIRLNLDLDKGYVSRFGVQYPSKEFDDCIRYMRENEYVEIDGIHSHVHGCRSLEYWKNRARILAQIAKEYAFGVVDMGSGFYGPMEERFAKHFPKAHTFYEYASVIAIVWNEEFKGMDDCERPVLILEPGTPLVANTVSILCEVVNIKEAYGKTFAVTNACLYDFGFLWVPTDCIIQEDGSKKWVTKEFPFDIISYSESPEFESVDIVGYTCVEGDVLFRNFKGKIGVGDKLLFRNCGAYTYSMRNNFIKKPLEMIRLDD